MLFPIAVGDQGRKTLSGLRRSVRAEQAGDDLHHVIAASGILVTFGPTPPAHSAASDENRLRLEARSEFVPRSASNPIAKTPVAAAAVMTG